MSNSKFDKRPDPKPRKLARLWQSYLMWDELVEMRKRHVLRASSIEAGKSNLDLTMEVAFLEATAADILVERYKKEMIIFGKDVPVWDWLTSIKGLKEGSLAAQLLAQIDDIAKFSNVSKLWRFAGYGQYEYWIDSTGGIVAPREGKIPVQEGKPTLPGIKGTVTGVVDPKERTVVFTPEPHQDWHLETRRDAKIGGFVSPFNTRLKSTVFLVGDQFIRQQTPVYSEIYYAEKIRQRQLHPEPIRNSRLRYNDGHIHMMALRKMEKIFLQHLWVQWRTAEGLPTNAPYVIAHMGHSDFIEPPFQDAVQAR